jgi:hypothetical protein
MDSCGATLRLRTIYDASMTNAEWYRAVGPFVFNKTEYWRVLNERATILSAS